jgi:nitroreductase
MFFEQFRQVLEQRASIRDFTEQEPDIDEIEEVMKLAARAPSSKNTQPWRVDLVRGDALESLRREYVAAFDRGEQPNPDYEYGPSDQPPEWKTRARQVGVALFIHKGIGREAVEKRRAHMRANYEFFGAKQLLFLSTHKSAGLGNYMDCGIFLSNLLNAITAKGWGACASTAAIHYPRIVRSIIGDKALDYKLLCGVPFGIPADSHVNKFRTIRADMEEWFSVHNSPQGVESNFAQ